jgi:hypothetical protein
MKKGGTRLKNCRLLVTHRSSVFVIHSSYVGRYLFIYPRKGKVVVHLPQKKKIIYVWPVRTGE